MGAHRHTNAHRHTQRHSHSHTQTGGHARLIGSAKYWLASVRIGMAAIAWPPAFGTTKWGRQLEMHAMATAQLEHKL